MLGQFPILGYQLDELVLRVAIVHLTLVQIGHFLDNQATEHLELLFKSRTELLDSCYNLIDSAYLPFFQPLSSFFSQRLAFILVFASDLEKHWCATTTRALIFYCKAFTLLHENILLALE